MHTRKECWRALLQVLSASVLAVFPFATQVAFAVGTGLHQQDPSSPDDGQSAVGAFTPPEAIRIRKPVLYPRTEGFWTFQAGPSYGRVPSELGMSPDVLILRVGSFVTKGTGLNIPGELRAPEKPVGGAYYLVQFTPAAFAPGRLASSLSELALLGAKLIEYVPNNGWLVRLDDASHGTVSSSPLLQYVGRYHPAYKIAPEIGTAPLPDPEKAASPIYSLIIRGWPGEEASNISAQVAALGGIVTYADDDAAGAWVLADLNKSRIPDLAGVEAVRSIEENLPRFLYGEVSSWSVIAGTYLFGVKPSIYVAGVDGSGRYLKDLDNAPTGNFPGSEDKDWNGNGVLDNAAQIVADTDTGMAVDAGDFSENAASLGLERVRWQRWPQRPEDGKREGLRRRVARRLRLRDQRRLRHGHVHWKQGRQRRDEPSQVGLVRSGARRFRARGSEVLRPDTLARDDDVGASLRECLFRPVRRRWDRLDGRRYDR